MKLNYVIKFLLDRMDKNWGKKKKLSNTTRHVSVMGINDLTEKSLDLMKLTANAEAEQKIQSLIILNAWRQQREKNKQLEADLKRMSNHVESLQLQMYTLRQLLDSEKTRVVNVNYDLRRILSALEECKHEKHLLLKEKDELETRLHDMEDRVMKTESEYKNQKNELLTARSEAQTWEKQLEKEREKLSRMKDERKFFIDEDIQELGEESKETTNATNSKKTSRESRVKSTSSKGGKKNSGRGREDRGAGKVDFGKNVGSIKKLLKESLSLFDEPD